MSTCLLQKVSLTHEAGPRIYLENKFYPFKESEVFLDIFEAPRIQMPSSHNVVI